jgi:hypothetical protein
MVVELNNEVPLIEEVLKGGLTEQRLVISLLGIHSTKVEECLSEINLIYLSTSPPEMFSPR